MLTRNDDGVQPLRGADHNPGRCEVYIPCTEAQRKLWMLTAGVKVNTQPAFAIMTRPPQVVAT